MDHTLNDQSSILRFIEDNWGLGRIGGDSTDVKAGSLLNMFDFNAPPRTGSLVLSSSTGEVVSDTLGGPVLPPPLNGGSSSSSVTVNSVDRYGNALTGYYTALYDSSGDNLAAGFTTTTSSTTAGQTYDVKADNYGSCTFARWSDGVTSDPRPFTAADGASSFTAVYGCGTPASSTIYVSTVDSAGHPITGYYTTLWQNGVQLQSCFSSCSFTVSAGQTYQVLASSYGSETFNRWLNDGSTGFETVNVPSTGAGDTRLRESTTRKRARPPPGGPSHHHR